MRWLLLESVWGTEPNKETLLKYRLADTLVVKGQVTTDSAVLSEAIQTLNSLPLIRVMDGWDRYVLVHPDKLRILLRDAFNALKSIDPTAAGRVSPDVVTLVVEPPPELQWTRLNKTLERFLPGVRKGEPDAVDAFIQVRSQMVPMRLDMVRATGRNDVALNHTMEQFQAAANLANMAEHIRSLPLMQSAATELIGLEELVTNLPGLDEPMKDYPDITRRQMVMGSIQMMQGRLRQQEEKLRGDLAASARKDTK